MTSAPGVYAVWYRVDMAEYYGGAWHSAGYFQNPGYQNVVNYRAGWLSGGTNRWASDVYPVNVR